MSDQGNQDFFVDLVSNVSHANGVFRLTFAQQEAEGSVRPVLRIFVPVTQLQRILKSVADAVGEISAQVRAQAQAAAASVGEAQAAGSAGEKAKKPAPAPAPTAKPASAPAAKSPRR